MLTSLNDTVHSYIPVSEVDAVVITAIIAGLIAIWGVFNQWAITRRQLTFQHISNKDSDRDMIQARKRFIELAKKPHGLAKWADPSHEASEEIESIRLVLNDYELTAIGCQLKIIDYVLIERNERSAIIKYWFHAAPFVYALRARLGNSTIYHEFEELARSMTDITLPHRSFGLDHIFKWARRRR
ncbi:DUF4760 domain-containing protein [Asticcacaulis sp. 201]|uniref:DUF4760 domain-containing protein n=1 Tax=Asticcacaulis sp. 201 TaxID=3028787 RepID=UPI0029165B24|nr:DUF4760 domain-containing protein [Asticcacaulis sp. 201]MDV6329992.1 DUF4760 domain-containing protein [Asticcacaulis sp. 201]